MRTLHCTCTLVYANCICTALALHVQAFRRIIFSEAKSLTEAFLLIDTNRSGFCDAEELRAVFVRASIEMSTEEVRALVDAYDSNGDGKIDLAELTKLLNTTSRFNDSGRGIKRNLVK